MKKKYRLKLPTPSCIFESLLTGEDSFIHEASPGFAIGDELLLRESIREGGFADTLPVAPSAGGTLVDFVTGRELLVRVTAVHLSPGGPKPLVEVHFERC